MSDGNDRPTAVGAYIFAGGFTLGVQDHFEILAHLEGSGYGVDVARKHWPNLPIYIGRAAWPVEDLRKRGVDFLYANPPCAIFSAMGIRTTRGAEGWKTDPRLGCWLETFGLLEGLRPAVWALESVTQAYTTGRPLIDELTRRALLLGYSVTHLLIDASWYGLPQRRKRFFLVCHRAARLSIRSLNWAPPPTVGEVLAEVASPGEIVPAGWPDALVRETRPGEGVSSAWERMNPPETRTIGSRGQTVGRPSFKDQRLRLDRTMGAYLGDAYLHPVEHRKIGISEAKALCGYPENFELLGPVSGQGSLLARAVMPPVGRWLADTASRTLHAPDAAWSERTVTLVDLREPDRPPVDLTGLYVGADGRVRLRVRSDGSMTFSTVPTPAPVPAPQRSLEPRQPPVSEPSSAAVFAEPAIALAPPVSPPVTVAPQPLEPQPSEPQPLDVHPAIVQQLVDVPAPESGEGSGKYIQRMWLAGFADPDLLVAAVHKHYPGRKTQRSDVYFNYRKLVDAGTPNLAPWKGTSRPREPRAVRIVGSDETKVEPAPVDDGRPRLLITGMTPSQCGSTRRPLKVALAGDGLARAFGLLGYAVERRPVVIGEDLSRYAAVLVGIGAPKTLAVHHLLPALWTLARRPDAIGFLDDWQTHEIVAGFRSHVIRTDRLWANPYLGHKEDALPFRDEIEAVGPRFVDGVWPVPVLTPVLGLPGNLDLLRLPARLIPFDPSPAWKRYPVPVPAPDKERRWLWASLLKKFDQLDELQRRAAWPIVAFGSQDKGMGGVGPRGERSLPRVPEPELVPEYARSWGVVTPAHPVSGSGWWRVRYLIARDVGAIVSGPAAEAALLGPSYEVASNVKAVEALTDEGLAALAEGQQHDLDAVTWSLDRLLTVLRGVVERKDLQAAA